MTDAEFLRDVSEHYLFWKDLDTYTRLRAIAIDIERMERELNRITQEAREAHAALTELKP